MLEKVTAISNLATFWNISFDVLRSIWANKKNIFSVTALARCAVTPPKKNTHTHTKKNIILRIDATATQCNALKFGLRDVSLITNCLGLNIASQWNQRNGVCILQRNSKGGGIKEIQKRFCELLLWILIIRNLRRNCGELPSNQDTHTHTHIYIWSSTDRLFRSIRTLQCG